MSLCNGLWTGIAGYVFVLQDGSRYFIAPVFPISQVFAQQGDRVLGGTSVVGHVCELLCSYVLLRQVCVLCISVH